MKGVDRRKQRKKQVYWVFNPFRWRTFEKWQIFLGKNIVRSGIRTHAHRSGLRPERSALDHSAILTTSRIDNTIQRSNVLK